MAGVKRGRGRGNLGACVLGRRLRDEGVKPGQGHGLRVGVGGGSVYCGPWGTRK